MQGAGDALEADDGLFLRPAALLARLSQVGLSFVHRFLG